MCFLLSLRYFPCPVPAPSTSSALHKNRYISVVCQVGSTVFSAQIPLPRLPASPLTTRSAWGPEHISMRFVCLFRKPDFMRKGRQGSLKQKQKSNAGEEEPLYIIAFSILVFGRKCIVDELTRLHVFGFVLQQDIASTLV